MPTDDPRDNPRVQRGDAGIKRNRAVAEESRSDGGDPIAALRGHFGDNVQRLRRQIEQAEKELRSLEAQHSAFAAGLHALDGPSETPPDY